MKIRKRVFDKNIISESNKITTEVYRNKLINETHSVVFQNPKEVK